MRQPTAAFVLKSALLISLLAVSFSATYAADRRRQAPQLTSSDVEFWVGSSSYLHPFTVPSSPDNWLGGSGNWSNGADWSAGEPGSGSDVFINTGNDIVMLDTSASINSLTLGGSSGSSTLADQSGGGYTVSIAGALTINQTGTLTLSSGDLLTANADSSNAGTINLEETTLGGASLGINGNFTNSGAIQLSGHVNSVTVSGNFANTGSIQEQQGGAGLNTFLIGGGLVNSGTISLYNEGDMITANASSSNSGTMNLFYGASLVVNGNFTNSGFIQLNSCCGVDPASVSVSGNLINTSRGNMYDVGAVDDLSVGGTLTNAGQLTIANLTVAGALTNTGGLQIVGVPNFYQTMPPSAAASLNNQGTVGVYFVPFLINGDAMNSGRIDVGGENMQSGSLSIGGTLTNTSTGQITTTDGFGVIGAANLSNSGTIQITTGYSELSVSGNVSNSGTITTSGSTDSLSVGGRFTNLGAGTLQLSGNSMATIATLVNLGTIAVGSGSTLSVPPGATASGNALAGFLNVGNVTITSGGTVSSPSKYLQTGGQTTVDGHLNGVVNFSGGSVYGNGGTISGNVTSNAAINIGDMPMTVGQLSIMGNYTQGANGSLTFDIASLSQYDKLNVSGHAQLNGLMTVELLNGYIPQIGNLFDIMNFASESGTFSTVLGLPINNQEHFVLEYNATNLTLDVVAGPGLQATSGHGSSPGYSKGEPFVTPVTQDISFQSADEQGASSVPEPSSFLLLGSGLIGVASVRRRHQQRKHR